MKKMFNKFYELKFKNNNKFEIVLLNSFFSDLMPFKNTLKIFGKFYKNNNENLIIETDCPKTGESSKIETKIKTKDSTIKKVGMAIIGSLILATAAQAAPNLNQSDYFGNNTSKHIVNSFKKQNSNLSNKQVNKLKSAQKFVISNTSSIKVKKPIIEKENNSVSNQNLENIINIQIDNPLSKMINSHYSLSSNPKAEHQYKNLSKEDKEFISKMAKEISKNLGAYTFDQYCKILDIKPTPELAKQFEQVFKQIKVEITNSEYDETKELDNGFNGHYDISSRSIKLFIPGFYNPKLLKKLKEDKKLLQNYLMISFTLLVHENFHSLPNYLYNKETNTITLLKDKLKSAAPEVIAIFGQNQIIFKINNNKLLNNTGKIEKKDVLYVFSNLYSLGITKFAAEDSLKEMINQNKKYLLKYYKTKYKNNNLTKEEMVAAKLLHSSNSIEIKDIMNNISNIFTNQRSISYTAINEYPQAEIVNTSDIGNIREMYKKNNDYFKFFQIKVDPKILSNYKNLDINNLKEQPAIEARTLNFFLQEKLKKEPNFQNTKEYKYLLTKINNDYKEILDNSIGIFNKILHTYNINPKILGQNNIILSKNSNVKNLENKLQTIYDNQHQITYPSQ